MELAEYMEYLKKEYDPVKYPLKKWREVVKFRCPFNEDDRIHEGVIVTIDNHGGGICYGITPSYDIQCEDEDNMIYKHVSVCDVIYDDNKKQIEKKSSYMYDKKQLNAELCSRTSRVDGE